MRTRLFVVLAMIVCVGGVPGIAAAQEPIDCGPKGEKHEVIKHKDKQRVPKPSAGRSTIVIVVGGSFYKSYQQKLAVNGQWRAVMNESAVQLFRGRAWAAETVLGGEDRETRRQLPAADDQAR